MPNARRAERPRDGPEYNSGGLILEDQGRERGVGSERRIPEIAVKIGGEGRDQMNRELPSKKGTKPRSGVLHVHTSLVCERFMLRGPRLRWSRMAFVRRGGPHRGGHQWASRKSETAEHGRGFHRKRDTVEVQIPASPKDVRVMVENESQKDRKKIGRVPTRAERCLMNFSEQEGIAEQEFNRDDRSTPSAREMELGTITPPSVAAEAQKQATDCQGHALPPAADGSKLIWSLIRELEDKQNRLVLFGKQSKDEFQRPQTHLCPQLLGVGDRALHRGVTTLRARELFAMDLPKIEDIGLTGAVHGLESDAYVIMTAMPMPGRYSSRRNTRWARGLAYPCAAPPRLTEHQRLHPFAGNGAMSAFADKWNAIPSRAFSSSPQGVAFCKLKLDTPRTLSRRMALLDIRSADAMCMTPGDRGDPARCGVRTGIVARGGEDRHGGEWFLVRKGEEGVGAGRRTSSMPLRVAGGSGGIDDTEDLVIRALPRLHPYLPLSHTRRERPPSSRTPHPQECHVVKRLLIGDGSTVRTPHIFPRTDAAAQEGPLAAHPWCLRCPAAPRTTRHETLTLAWRVHTVADIFADMPLAELLDAAVYIVLCEPHKGAVASAALRPPILAGGTVRSRRRRQGARGGAIVTAARRHSRCTGHGRSRSRPTPHRARLLIVGPVRGRRRRGDGARSAPIGGYPLDVGAPHLCSSVARANARGHRTAGMVGIVVPLFAPAQARAGGVSPVAQDPHRRMHVPALAATVLACVLPGAAARSRTGRPAQPVAAAHARVYAKGEETWSSALAGVALLCAATRARARWAPGARGGCVRLLVLAPLLRALPCAVLQARAGALLQPVLVPARVYIAGKLRLRTLSMRRSQATKQSEDARIYIRTRMMSGGEYLSGNVAAKFTPPARRIV
ncbi:hypothetical protein DFH09DRAFT_1087534 [Mycena vulgaris]|nr:hypothetical protein DFH09DRAFT_1087534 [Mycena vulgaris]